MRFIIIFLSLIALSIPVYAASTLDIKVNGMVCDFCAQSVWKVFKDYEAVEDVNINLDTGIVTIHLKDGMSLTEEELDKGITYAGYELVSITEKTD